MSDAGTGALRGLISDIPGVRVGHCTLSEGAVQTGVTAILPHGGNLFEQKVAAACQVFNGFAKPAGLIQLAELGWLESPVLLTNTLSVGTAYTALVRHALERNPQIGRETGTVNPLVLECNDGWLNDIRAMSITQEHVFSAIGCAHERFALGSVGAGRGMRCHGLKGGIGSASARVEAGEKQYTLGALVLSNHGRLEDLTIAGRALGQELIAARQEQEERGSVIIVLATDAPMSSAQLRRLCRRAPLGLGRTGASMGNGSGEIALAFSTANRLRHFDAGAVRSSMELNERWIDPFFAAAAALTHQAVLRSLFHAVSVEGREGHRAPALADLLSAPDFESLKRRALPHDARP